MANGRKEYQIVINGIKESVNAVQSLNAQLDVLQEKMTKLTNVTVNVSSPGRTQALDEEAKMLQQIEQLHQKVAASEKESYQELLAAKAELKEYQAIAKSIASQTALDQGHNNLNTMQGMKAQLADIKTAMQTIDVNSEKFKQMQQQANELNNKLKEIEQGYGQFGRNVGNYSEGVAQGLQQVTIKVGETERTFGSAREAARTLGNELKSMAVNGQQGTQAYKDLNSAVKQLNSAIADVSRSSVAMDRMLDTVQSVVAIASVAKGFGALFGVDDKEIQKSIQQLMALQNAMKGLETINKQLTTQEGIGFWLAKSNKMVDSFAASLLKVDKNAATASKKVVYLAGALKILGGVGIAVAITAIVMAIKKLNKAIDEVKETAKANAEIVKSGAEAYAKAKLELDGYIRKINTFNGTSKEEKKLVTELNNKYGETLGKYKSLQEWRDALIANSPAYLKMLKNEAMAQANYQVYAQKYSEALAEEAEAEELINKAYKLKAGDVIDKYEADKLLDQAKKLQESARIKKAAADENEIAGDKLIASNEELKKSIKKGTYDDTTPKKIKDNSKKEADAIRQAEEMKNALRLRLMKDGLRKQLVQLDEANRKEIEKIKQNGKNVEELIKMQEQAYAEDRKKIIDDYIDALKTEIKQLDFSIAEDDIELLSLMSEALKKVTKEIKTFADSSDVKKGVKIDILSEVLEFSDLKQQAQATGKIDSYYKYLLDYMSKQSKEKQDDFKKVFDEAFSHIGDSYNPKAEMREAKEKIIAYIEGVFKETNGAALKLADKYGVNVLNVFADDETDTLKTSLYERVGTILDYYNNMEAVLLKKEKEITEKRKKLLDERQKEEEAQAHSSYIKELQELPEKDDENYKAINEANILAAEKYEKKIIEITSRYANERIEIERNSQADISKIYDDYFSEMLATYSEFQQKLNSSAGNQPALNIFGVVNWSQTKKNYDEIAEAAAAMANQIEWELDEVEKKFKGGLITPEVYTATKRNLQDAETAVNDTISSIKQKSSDLPADFIKSIEQYANAIGNAVSTLITDFGSLYEYNLDKQQKQLEEQNKLLEDQYQKQEDIVKSHTDAIKDIEDELANSRGDRRQMLIDQLNAETQARREAAAEQKRIQKEQEQNEKRMEELEKKRNMAQYKRDLAQILISGALAAANGYATKPFVPTGLIMGSIAATLTAAQYAIAKAQKPYAKGGQLDGGVIQGKRHSQGGVPVLGGRASVEGGEYILNRRTTANNVELLDFLNSKKHRVNLSEIIEFYNGDINRKYAGSKTRFANGGQLPTMADIDLSGIMTDVAIVRDDRPVVVSVVDINKKQADVRRVKTLAGAE